MSYISEESIQEVQHATDIFELVSRYFPLKRTGSSYKALCPFHEEKTPSFVVTPQKQIFKCFGCQKGGGVFTFVMEMEKVGFPEAVRILAERAGITLKENAKGDDGGADRNDLYRVHEWAESYFRRLLLSSPEAAQAKEYLIRRGIGDDVAEQFQLGYALDSWNGLLNAAKKINFSERLLLAAGLILSGQESSSYYDRFRGRLMIPIRDPQGRVIGFGARALGDIEPKYLNSPETAIFNKGRNFYGIHLVRDVLEKERTACIVEGYFDMMMPYQHGFRNLIATLGTALTTAHIGLLKRYVDKVILLYDADNAGRKASERSLDMLLGEEIDIYVAELPQGMDPCDCVVNGKADALRQAIASPREIFSFLVDSLTAKVDMRTPAGRTKAIEDILARIASVSSPIKREVLIRQVSERFQMDEKVIRTTAAAIVRRRDDGATPGKEGMDRDQLLGRELVAIMLYKPDLIPEVRKHLAAEEFPTELSKRMAGGIFSVCDRYGTFSQGAFVKGLEENDREALDVVADILSRDSPNDRYEEWLKGCLTTVERIRRSKRVRELNVMMKDAAERGDADKILLEKQSLWKK